MTDKAYPIAIIGAGASGLIAAIAAARMRPQSVVLLEKEARVGRKLLSTGNGRCNLLNKYIKEEAYHGSGSSAALSLLAELPPQYLLDYFGELGLLCREEDDGRFYPYSGQAASVLDTLRCAVERLRVDVRCETHVVDIKREKHGFALIVASGSTIHASRVLFATGGKAAPALGADGTAFHMMTALGHTLVPLRPALSPLKLPAERIRGLKGIRVRGTAALLINGKIKQTEIGEILFTEYGISGIAVMQLSQSAGDALAKNQSVAVNLSLLDPQTASMQIKTRLSLFRQQTMESICTGLLPKRICLSLLREAGIAPSEAVSRAAVERVFALLSGWTLPIIGILPFQNAQITAGGLSMDEFEPSTLESKLIPGVYACGEALDVNGDCGGYNLMWAWVSGITAGHNAALSL